MELPVTAYAFSGIKFRVEPKFGYFASLLFNYGQFKAREYLKVDGAMTSITKSVKDKIVGIGGEFGICHFSWPRQDDHRI